MLPYWTTLLTQSILAELPRILGFEAVCRLHHPIFSSVSHIHMLQIPPMLPYLDSSSNSKHPCRFKDSNLSILGSSSNSEHPCSRASNGYGAHAIDFVPWMPESAIEVSLRTVNYGICNRVKLTGCELWKNWYLWSGFTYLDVRSWTAYKGCVKLNSIRGLVHWENLWVL